MRVTLLHNESAGSEDHAREDLAAALQRAGHHLVDVATRVEDLVATIDRTPCDLVVIAGGDGTVSRAACTLAGRQVPLGILPLGTANNTAKSLGLPSGEPDLDALIAGWEDGSFRDLDLATLQEGDRIEPFSECVGWGIFPDVIAKASELSLPEQREHTLERDRRVFRSVIERAKPSRFRITAGTETIAGDYLLVEIVNIPNLGPQLELSPDSNPSDGKLELVVAAEADRPALLELARTGKLPDGTRLPTVRGERFSVQTDRASYHRDGKLLSRDGSAEEFSIAVEPAAVRHLKPRAQR